MVNVSIEGWWRGIWGLCENDVSKFFSKIDVSENILDLEILYIYDCELILHWMLKSYWLLWLDSFVAD